MFVMADESVFSVDVFYKVIEGNVMHLFARETW